MELFAAHHQWANRPADERFTSLEAMLAACRAYAGHAGEAVVPWHKIEVTEGADGVGIKGPDGSPAILTHYAFGQLAARAQAPAGFLRELPAPLAADVLRNRLAGKSGADDAQILFHVNSGLVARALTTTNYVRIWNWEVIERLLDVCERTGMQPASPTFRQKGNDQPALYASDHDMFAFVMTPTRVFKDPAGQDLFRGVIIQNSEVGDCSLAIIGFYFRDVCGNHIIWGAKEIAEVRLTHRGQIRQRWHDAQLSVRKFLDSPAPEFTTVNVPIGATKADVLDAVFGKRIPGLSRKAIGDAFDMVKPEEDGSPLTAYGLAQGITRYSQLGSFADERVQLDRAAGKLLQVRF